MRHVIWLAMLLWSSAAAADAPFMPLPNTVDHVVTMVTKWASGPQSRVVTHHAGWTRVDRSVGRDHASTVYHGHVKTISVNISRDSAGQYAYLAILRGPEQHKIPQADYTAFKTGERETFLGESCDVWSVMRSSFTKFSCITEDGIELWSKSVGSGDWTISSQEATKVERRPVQASEVQPPGDLLALSSWVDPASSTPATPGTPADFETLMQSEGAKPTDTWHVTKTTRRRHPWTYEEEVLGTGKRMVLSELASVWC